MGCYKDFIVLLVAFLKARQEDVGGGRGLRRRRWSSMQKGASDGAVFETRLTDRQDFSKMFVADAG